MKAGLAEEIKHRGTTKCMGRVIAKDSGADERQGVVITFWEEDMFYSPRQQDDCCVSEKVQAVH